MKVGVFTELQIGGVVDLLVRLDITGWILAGGCSNVMCHTSRPILSIDKLSMQGKLYLHLENTQMLLYVYDGFIHTHTSPIHINSVSHKNYSWGN